MCSILPNVACFPCIAAESWGAHGIRVCMISPLLRNSSTAVNLSPSHWCRTLTPLLAFCAVWLNRPNTVRCSRPYDRTPYGELRALNFL